MEHYVTIFDQLFLPQGLALHQSLSRHAGAFTLWVVCVNDEAHDALMRLDLPSLKPMKLGDLECDRLRKVKAERTNGEYCWTLTPFSFKFVFDAEPNARRVTYVDADLWLRKNPRPIFEELETSGKAILITDHAYAPEHDQSELSGQFCVQFLTFYRDAGETVRQWWADRCIEWCYARQEDGKFGDQKYLDCWPEMFGELVHVLTDKELMLAPWNASRFPRAGAVAYHFHGLRLLPDRRVWMVGNYNMPQGVVDFIYKPYLADMAKAISLMASIGLQAAPQKPASAGKKKSLLSLTWRRLRGKPCKQERFLVATLP